MSTSQEHDEQLMTRGATRLMDVFVRLGLLVALALLCYRVFSPFLTLMIWALILSVTLFPLHQAIASRIGGRNGLASTVVLLLGLALIVTPTAILTSSMADSIQQLIEDVRDNRLAVPAPRAGVAQWPLVGPRMHGMWTMAHEDLPAFVQSLQPKIGNIAKGALAFVASVGTGVLMFLAAFIVAGVVMAYGQAGAQTSRAIFTRIVGPGRGEEFTRLVTATIRAVAQGVVGVAFIQAIVVGLSLLLAGVPWAGVLAAVTLVLGIAQLPALLVTLPAIAYLWSSGNYGTVAAVGYTVLLFVSGMLDNVLKPLMLGRGVEAPMPVILIGALGGMAAAGILGMFVGSTLLALGYQIFMGWVADNPDGGKAEKAEKGPE